jgi:hypothetical protein
MSVRKWLSIGLLAAFAVALTSDAFARGRGRPGFRIAVRPAYGFFGFAAPFPLYRYSPRYFVPVRGNYGSVDFNVRPQKSEIYVDGVYIGIADEFNGYPRTATLPAGRHRIRVVAPNGRVENREIYVMPGRELNFNLRF